MCWDQRWRRTSPSWRCVANKLWALGLLMFKPVSNPIETVQRQAVT